MLKQLLIKYDILFTMNEEDYFKLVLTDKATHEQEIIEGKNYSEVVRKCYRNMLKQIAMK
jgi:hypothetical protein